MLQLERVLVTNSRLILKFKRVLSERFLCAVHLLLIPVLTVNKSSEILKSTENVYSGRN